MHRPKTPLLDFYRDECPTPEGHSYSTVMQMSDHELEGHHEYVQWLFPTTKASMFHDAPTLSAYEAEVFINDPTLQTKIVAAFDRMLRFWGFRREGNKVTSDGQPPVMSGFNHNWLRMTRVIASLRELGQRELASAFCVHLLKYPGIDMSRDFWVQAAGGVDVGH